MSSKQNETKDEVKPVTDEVKSEPVVEKKPVVIDERAVKLAQDAQDAIQASAAAEGEIAASQTLQSYANAGKCHYESISLGKAGIDYACEVRHVASTWTPGMYDHQINKITDAVRALNPELFTDFDSFKEKGSKEKASHSSSRIHTRVLVYLVAKDLAALIGDGVWGLPYRLFANYLVVERVFKFSKQDVKGELNAKHVEFLKTQLRLLIDKTATSANFLAELKKHFDEVDQAARAEAESHLTPEERKARADSLAQGEKAKAGVVKASAVKTKLVESLASACGGVLTPEDVAKCVKDAAKAADVVLPIGKMDHKNVTAKELDKFLENIISRGGNSTQERVELRKVIKKHGQALADAAAAKRAKMEANAELAVA